MSGSIKPPGGGPGPVEGPDASGELESTAEVGQAAPSEAPQATAETGTAAWLQRVDAGEISAQQAVDGIVADALSAPGAQGLSASQRSELESALRAALLDDPTLSALIGG